MDDLEKIICTILKKQAEPIAKQVTCTEWFFNGIRLPEVSVGYGFVFENEKLNLKISLECLEDDIEDEEEVV